MGTALYAMAVVLLVTVSVSRADAHGRGYRGYSARGRGVDGQVMASSNAGTGAVIDATGVF